MGRLKNMSNDLIVSRLEVLEEAGWTQEHWEAINADTAPRMLSCVEPVKRPDLPKGMETSVQIARIIIWYQQFAGITLTAEAIMAVLPDRPKKMDRLVVVAPGMKPSVCIKALKQQFEDAGGGVWQYWEDLDSSVVSVRSPDKLYAVWCRDSREADNNNRHKAATAFAQKDCLTLEERLIFEGLYFQQRRRHLDERCFTICPGSRYDGGDVSLVNWDSDHRTVNVHWFDVRSSNSGSAVRSVASL